MKSVIIISNDLPQMVDFPTWISRCDSHNPNRLILFISSDPSIWIPKCDSHSPDCLNLFIYSNSSICSTMDFLPLGYSDQVVVSISIDLLSNS